MCCRIFKVKSIQCRPQWKSDKNGKIRSALQAKLLPSGINIQAWNPYFGICFRVNPILYQPIPHLSTLDASKIRFCSTPVLWKLACDIQYSYSVNRMIFIRMWSLHLKASLGATLEVVINDSMLVRTSSPRIQLHSVAMNFLLVIFVWASGRRCDLAPPYSWSLNCDKMKPSSVAIETQHCRLPCSRLCCLLTFH